MPQNSNNIKRFLAYEGVDPQDRENVKKVLKKIPPSASRITPGDVLIFRYWLGAGIGSREQKGVLIVRCGRGAGVFPGRTGKIVSCFKFGTLSEAVLDVLMKNLYKRREVSTIDEVSRYLVQQKEALTALGVKAQYFRTYKLNKMKELHKVELGGG